MNRLQDVADLCLVDNTGTKIILTDKDAYWINAPETPVFVGEGKQVVVSSERTGHRHVYLYKLSGELVRDLTPGDLEVYHLHEATIRRTESLSVAALGTDKSSSFSGRIWGATHQSRLQARRDGTMLA